MITFFIFGKKSLILDEKNEKIKKKKIDHFFQMKNQNILKLKILTPKLCFWYQNTKKTTFFRNLGQNMIFL